MVGIGAEETSSRVAIATLGAGIRVWGRGDLADGYGAVVATRARPGNSRMIEAAVRVQRQKTGGIVAVVALGIGRQMRCGFTDRQNTVMALAAIAEHFPMIDKRSPVETQRSMTGLAHTAGSGVIRRFTRNFARTR